MRICTVTGNKEKGVKIMLYIPDSDKKVVTILRAHFLCIHTLIQKQQQCTDRKNWPAGRGFSKNSLFESLEEMKIYGISRVADT